MANVKQQARQWENALRRTDPKEWDAVSDRMVRTVMARGGVRSLKAVGEAMETLNAAAPALPVTLVCARDLDDKTERHILNQLFGDQEVTVIKKIDPALIAGVIVRTEDKQWDLSVRHQLERLKRSIVEA